MVECHQNPKAANGYRLFRLKTEPWRRWANGFSCLFFVTAGIPLSIRQRSGDFLTSFFLCFLPILLVGIFSLDLGPVVYVLIGLGTLYFPMGMLAMAASWPITKHVKAYCILFLLLEMGMLGVFMALLVVIMLYVWRTGLLEEVTR